MAANSKSSREIANLGKRVANHFFTRDPAHSAFTRASRRAAHSSVYDKNIEEEVRPAIVPDNVIDSLSEKYWAPHPKTGIFGPAVENSPGAGREPEHHTSPANGSGESVLEEKAWFRPTSLEDSEKPLQH